MNGTNQSQSSSSAQALTSGRHISRRALAILSLVAITALTAVQPAAAKPDPSAFPSPVPLPNGFQPEGIAIGRGTEFFVGSIPTGAIYRGDLQTGQGAILVPGQTGRAAIGIKVDERTNYLWVSGGPTGMAFVYDAGTGAALTSYQLTTQATFINDVVVTRNAVFFTDSFRPVLYRVQLDQGGRLLGQEAVSELALSGEFDFEPGSFNTNGIAASPNDKWLIIVNSTLGTLYRVDPATGEAKRIDLGGATVPNGDGILLHGKTLYVVQNRLNQIAVINLDPGLASGVLERTITDPAFRVPTTIARFGNALYAVNARFGTPPTPDTDYDVVRVNR